MVDLAMLEAIFLVAMGGWLIVLGGAFLLGQRTVDRVSAILLMLAGAYAILWQEPALVGVGETFHVAVAQPVFLLLLSGAIFLWTYWLFERHVDKLEDTRDELADSLELERTLVDVLSHDLRNPLAAAHLNVQTLAQDNPELRSQLDPIEDDLSRAADVMADGLVYSRITSGGEPPALDTIDMTDVVDGALAHCRNRAEAREITLEHEAPDEVLLEASPLLERAVENLVDNAIKFSPEGGTVTVRTRPDPQGVVVSVSDEGPGMVPEDRERLFGRFERGSGDHAGAGLGLAIVHRLVDLHGGAIEVESTSAGGTRILLRLPDPQKDDATSASGAPGPTGLLSAKEGSA